MRLINHLIFIGSIYTQETIYEVFNNSTYSGNDYLMPILDKGVLLAFSEPDKFLIDYEVQKLVSFEVLGPASNYMANLHSSPFPRFCGVSEADERKYLHEHISNLNRLWNENLEGYESFIDDSSRHKRGVLQASIMLLIALYHYTKYQHQSYEHNQFDQHVIELSAKLSQLESDSTNLLMQSQNILSIVQSYWCSASQKFKEIKEEIAKQSIRSYISEVHATLGQAIKDQLPSDPEAINHLTGICENMNSNHYQYCKRSVIKGLKSSFRGFSTDSDSFSSTKIIIKMMVSFPIYSQNQFAYKITAGNVGYYNNSIRNNLLVPPVSYILRHNDTNFDRYTPVVIPCTDFNCPPTTLITELTPNSCLKGILFSLPETSDICYSKPVIDSCVGIFFGNDTFLVNGVGLFKPSDQTTPFNIEKPTLVSTGDFICTGKMITFRSAQISGSRVILNSTSSDFQPTSYSNYSDYDSLQEQIIDIHNDLTHSITNHTLLKKKFHNFRSSSSGTSKLLLISLILTILGFLYPAVKLMQYFSKLIKSFKTNQIKRNQTRVKISPIIKFHRIDEYPFAKKMHSKAGSSPNLTPED